VTLLEGDRDRARPAESPLLRNGYALMANTAVTAALGLAYWLAAARLYPASAVGAGGAAVSAMLFAAGVSQLNLMGAVTRFVPVAGAASKRFLASAYGASTACAVVVGTIAVATSPWWAPPDSPLRSGALAGLLFVVGVVSWCVFVLQDSALTATRQAVWVPVENGLYGLVKLALLVGFAVAVAGLASPNGILASWALPAVAAIVPVNLVLFRRFIPAHVAGSTASGGRAPFPLSMRQVARFVGGDYAGSLCNQALISLMPLLVVALEGSVGGGHFYVAWTIATTMDLLASNLATSLTVEGALAEDRLAHYGREVLRRVVVVLVPIVAAVVVGAGMVLSLFGSDYRANSATLLRLLALATLPRALSTVYLGLCRVERRVSRIAAVQAAQAVLVLGLAAVLVPWLGIAGAGVAALAGQSAVALAVWPRLRERV